jgi:uncharacterized YigZ family protein
MFTTQTETQTQYEVNKSKFLSHVVPITQFEKRLAELKALHPKARHFVTASRHLNAYDQVVESFSDDGEPKGVAGMPTLKVLQGQDVINAAVITVRYFGGIKLGTGGMARAYADAANLAVGEAPLEEYIKPYREQLTVAYNDLSRLEHAVGGYDDVGIESRDYGAEGIAVQLKGREASVREIISGFRNG